MSLRDIFRNVRNGDIQRINNEYGRIRQECHDAFIGTEMMQNDLNHNLKIWDSIEQTMINLFQDIERVSILKQEIINHLNLPSNTIKLMTVTSSYTFHVPKDLIVTKALYFYKKAYTSAVTGDIEAFRDYALDYRIISGLKNKELSDLLQRLKEFIYYVELDEINIKHLWNIYQKNDLNIRELLHKALVNHIFHNGNVCIDTYLECVLAVNNCLKEVI